MNYDLEFENMGRNAATILHSNFEFRLQRFVEENIVNKHKRKIGKQFQEQLQELINKIIHI